MKKIISIVLILSIIVGLMASCQNAENAVPDNAFHRIVVIKEPSKYDKPYFQKHLGEYTNLQETLDEIVDIFNKTQDNEKLYKICLILEYREYFKDSDELIIDYYSKFFDEIWDNDNLNKKTEDSQKTLACILSSTMYDNGKQIEAVDFLDKFMSTIHNADEKVYFSSDCLYNFFFDPTVEQNNDTIAALLEIIKNLEKNYYAKVDYMNKARIYQMISMCYEKLGDTKSSEEYKDKTRQVIQEWTEKSSQ